MRRITLAISRLFLNLPQTAIKFALAHEALSTVITGIRSVAQAEMNTLVSELENLDHDTLIK